MFLRARQLHVYIAMAILIYQRLLLYSSTNLDLLKSKPNEKILYKNIGFD